MKEILEKIRILTVLESKEIGNGYEAKLVQFIDKETENEGIILLITKEINGLINVMETSDPVLNTDSEYAFLDAALSDIYVFAEIRNGWNVTIISQPDKTGDAA